MTLLMPSVCKGPKPSMNFVCVCVYAVWICRRPAYHSLWAHEGRYGGWGLGAADMTAQFKEIGQEMQWEGEHSSLYTHLGQAWENSTPPSPSCPRLWSQAKKQVDLQVLCGVLKFWICQDLQTVEKKIPLYNIQCISITAKSWKMAEWCILYVQIPKTSHINVLKVICLFTICVRAA